MEEKNTKEHPKLFISYSWSSADHEQWVLDLAIRLRKSGVDVVFDKWHLKVGHDAHVFMEKMVADPDIKKVAIICDRTYVEKADSRSGGVGTETQIITPKIYKKQDQDKFVAIIKERDDKGEPFLPIYYRSRIYIDFSNPDLEAKNFEQLLRWIYNDPLHEEPILGEKPAFLSAKDMLSLGTTSLYDHALKAIREGRGYATGAINEYFETFSRNIERFQITRNETEFDEKVIQSIEQFTPYRDQATTVFLGLAQYLNTQETWRQLHHFFESMIHYLDRPLVAGSWYESDFDNFRFIVNELFLYAVASFLKYESFDAVAYLVGQPYYDENRSSGDLVSVKVFNQSINSLAHRNKRLALGRVSLLADLLKKRCTSSIPFEQIMQADFILYIRSELDSKRGIPWSTWRPETLIYAEHRQTPFPIFVKSQSKAYLMRLMMVFDIKTTEELDTLVEAFRDRGIRVPSWEHISFAPVRLMGYDKLGTLR